MTMQLAPVQEVTPARLVRSVLSVHTAGPGFIDLTGPIRDFLQQADAEDGLLTAFVKHTSASLTIQENADPDVRRDLLDVLDTLAPQHGNYRHGMEGPDDMPAHIRTMLTDVSLTIPVRSGGLDVGTWQSLYLVEHRTRPHARSIVLAFLGS